MTKVPENPRQIVDAEGHLRRTEAREKFWRIMREIAKHAIVELLDPRPATRMIEQWSRHDANYENAMWQCGHTITLLRHGPFPLAFQDFEVAREAMGPLWDWPIGHVDHWLEKYDVSSPDLRADAIVTLSSYLYLGETGPELDSPNSPTSVFVYKGSARLAAEDIGLVDRSWVRFERQLFSKDEIVLLSSLAQGALERRDHANTRLRSELNEIVASAFRRFNSDTAKLAPVPDRYFDWFVRRRVMRADISSIMFSVDVDQRAVFHGIQVATELLGLPPREPGQP